jgi:hypothetical protein
MASETSSGSKLMGLFSGRNAKLETINHILTKTARERAERVQELERRVAQLEKELGRRVVQLEKELERRAQLEQELELARKRATELEVVANDRAHLLNKKDEELAFVRETLTESLTRNYELEQALANQK